MTPPTPANTLDPKEMAIRATCQYSPLKPAAKLPKPLPVPHLTLADAKGRSIVIHAGGDDYSDQPAPSGGGGARIACGVVK